MKDLDRTPKRVTNLFSKIKQTVLQIEKEDKSLDIHVVAHEDNDFNDEFVSILKIEVRQSDQTTEHRITFNHATNSFFSRFVNEKCSMNNGNDSKGRTLLLKFMTDLVRNNESINKSGLFN